MKVARKAVVDAYEVAKFVKHYQAKNVYAPKRNELSGCTPEEIDLLVKNGILELLPLFEGGEPICVVLTDKGRRMAEEAGEHRRRTRQAGGSTKRRT